MREFLFFNCPKVKIWCFSSFSKTSKIEKIEVFAYHGPVDILQSVHTCAHFSSIWVNSYILVVLKWKYDAFLHFQKIKKKSRKNWCFRWPRTCRRFWISSHMCRFFIQMREILYFSCPEVKIWCSSSFLKTFQRIEKIEVFAHRGPVDILGSIHTCVYFSSKWVNFYILVVLNWKSYAFCIFENFKKKKNEVYTNHRPVDIFGSIHTCTHFSTEWGIFLYFSCPEVKIWCSSSFLKTFQRIEKLKFSPIMDLSTILAQFTRAHFSSRWGNFYILVVLKWKYDAFLHFEKLFKKSKKLKFSPTADKLTFLAQFSHVHIFHLNEWIFKF